jgi:syntaxin of plants SYP7
MVNLVQKSERAAREKNRAAAVALNADVRRTKARLMDEAVKLQKIVAKKVDDRSIIFFSAVIHR